MFNLKLRQQEQGFTLVEVLIAILIAIIFVTATMQMMALAAVFKVRARQFAEATTWIQEDLEAVRYQASQLNHDATKCRAETINTGFGEFMKQNLPDLTVNNPNTGTQNILGKSFTITRIPNVRNLKPFEILGLTYSIAPQEAHTTLSIPASSTDTTISVISATGFKPGDKLTVGTDTDNEIASIFGNTISLKEPLGLGSTQPSGSVVDASITTLYTEIIPNAALQCSK